MSFYNPSSHNRVWSLDDLFCGLTILDWMGGMGSDHLLIATKPYAIFFLKINKYTTEALYCITGHPNVDIIT